MGKDVGVDPKGLRNGASAFGDLGDRVADVVNDLSTALSGRGAAWGDDKFGSQFADGAQGYLAGKENLEQGASNMASNFKKYQSGLDNAANNFDGNEGTSSDQYK